MNASDALDAFQGFDIAMIGEFLNNYGAGLEPLMTLFFIFIVFYFLFGVYANAAILYAVASQNNYIPLRSFWNGGLSYFWRIFRLSLYYLLAIAVSVVLIWFVLLYVGINVLEVYDDKELIYKIRWGLAVLGFLLIIFSIIKQYAKILIALRNHPYITGALARSSAFTFKYFFSTFLLYLCNMLAFALAIFIYSSLREVVNINAWMLTFFLAQGLLVFKIIFRIIHLHSCLNLYESIKS
jgi:hypothetical protein